MMIESIIAIIGLAVMVIGAADYLDRWERETCRWWARQALRDVTWERIEEIEFRSTL